MDVDFAAALARCLRGIPRGRVATCGTIARALGDPRAARAVATWLAENPGIPAGHRAVRSDGRPVLEGAGTRLAREGVRVQRGGVDPVAFVLRLRAAGFLDRLRDEQKRLATQVIDRDDERPIERVAGVDLAYRGTSVYAAAVSVTVEDFKTVDVALSRGRVEFPYIPTYLSYREFPGIEAAVTRLVKRPDALMVDGHGRLHPALFGIACHAGLRLGIPTIGIAKHPLAGRLIPGRGGRNISRVEIDGTTRGVAWRPPGRGRPIYVSVGHRFSLEGALALAQHMTKHTYPEPLRIADRLSREMKKGEKRERGATQ